MDGDNFRFISLNSKYETELCGNKWTWGWIYVFRYIFSVTLSHYVFPRKTQLLGPAPSWLHPCAADRSSMFSLASPSSPIWTNPCTLRRCLKIQNTQRVTQSPSCGQSKKCESWFFPICLLRMITFNENTPLLLLLLIMKLKCRQIMLWDMEGRSSALTPLILGVSEAQLDLSSPRLVSQLCRDYIHW